MDRPPTLPGAATLGLSGGVAALFLLQRLVRAWNKWLEASHSRTEIVEILASARQRRTRLLSGSEPYRPRTSSAGDPEPQRGVAVDAEGRTTLKSVRPRSLWDLARGFGTVCLYYGGIDFFGWAIRRDKSVVRDQVGRFYALHAAANLLVVLATWRDAARCLAAPVENAVAPSSILA